MLKHVGKHNQKKVIILYREVPGEDHMCLVSFSESLPSMIHDEIMTVLESPAGQESTQLADVLFRTVMKDGRNTLTALHSGGLIKKIATNQVIITPNAKSSIKLDELNRLLKEIEAGKSSSKKLNEIKSNGADASRRTRDVGEPAVVNNSEISVLTDADLAKQRVDQANKMKSDAARLLTEAEALLAEAAQLDPKLAHNESPKKRTKTKAQKD
jgi:SepF-like predicted cell division protein (DUF552 family)